MSDFNLENAKSRQNNVLERVEKIYKSLRDDVVDYYWEKAPQDEEEAIEYEREIRKYIKFAFDDLNKILYEEDKDLGY